MNHIPYTTIVTGLPRTGTSCMMQVLQAGGVPILADSAKQDEDNPRGYFELREVRNVRPAAWTWQKRSRGCAVKILAPRICDWVTPPRNVRAICMTRDIDEVLESRTRYAQRHDRPATDRDRAKRIFSRQITALVDWLEQHVGADWLTIDYTALVEAPAQALAEINALLDGRLDVDQAATAVDLNLYRCRANVLSQPAVNRPA